MNKAAEKFLDQRAYERCNYYLSQLDRLDAVLDSKIKQILQGNASDVEKEVNIKGLLSENKRDRESLRHQCLHLDDAIRYSTQLGLNDWFNVKHNFE